MHVEWATHDMVTFLSDVLAKGLFGASLDTLKLIRLFFFLRLQRAHCDAREITGADRNSGQSSPFPVADNPSAL